MGAWSQAQLHSLIQVYLIRSAMCMLELQLRMYICHRAVGLNSYPITVGNVYLEMRPGWVEIAFSEHYTSSLGGAILKQILYQIYTSNHQAE